MSMTEEELRRIENWSLRRGVMLSACISDVNLNNLISDQVPNLISEVRRYHVENADLREALEFYANYDNYCDFTDDTWHKIGGGFEASSDADTGEIARAALERRKKGET